MIADHLEPKGLSPDAEPLDSRYPNTHRADATKGSRALRGAILRSMGLMPKTLAKPAPIQPVREFQPTPCCECCGAPIRPHGKLISDIQATVSAYYRLPALAMVSDRRARRFARPRQIAMYLSRELTPKSLPDIGRRFGNRDHTTVIHAIRQVEKLIATDADIARDVETLRWRLAPEAMAA